MSTHDDAFTAEAKSLDYTFRAKAGGRGLSVHRSPRLSITGLGQINRPEAATSSTVERRLRRGTQSKLTTA